MFSKYYRRKVKKVYVIGFLLNFVCMFFTAIGISAVTHNNVDFGSHIAHVIRENNSKNKLTYWRCEPVSTRTNWLGGNIKANLTALSNPWAVYGESENNFCFLYTDASLGQTYIRCSNEIIVPVSIFASPCSRTFSCFDFKISDGSTPDGKYKFYCSESLYNLLSSDKNEADLIININNNINETNINFSNSITTIGNRTINELAKKSEYYIFVPYMLDDDTIISYDMNNFTGQSSFFAVMNNDKYQNNYYALMIQNILMTRDVNKQLSYKATFIDDFKSILLKYELIYSNVQNQFINFLLNGNEFNPVMLIIGIIFICLSIACLCFVLLTRQKYSYRFNLMNVIVSSSFASFLFYFLGEIIYAYFPSVLLLWDITSRILVLILLILLTIILSSIIVKDKERKNIENLKCYSIKI